MSITKNTILASVSDFDIFNHYIPNFDESILNSKKLLTSIFNPNEKNPSLSVYNSKNGIKFKCHSSGHQGDCFQLVADLYNLDNKSQFKQVLETIAADLRLQVQENSFSSDNWIGSYYASFTSKALAYWSAFNVDQKTLNNYYVKQLKSLKYKNKSGVYKKFDYESKNLIAFEFSVNGRKKLYVPGQPGLEKKYIIKTQIASDIFGLRQLPKSKLTYILLCEGEKDCLVAAAHNIAAVSFQSAAIYPSNLMVRQLLKHAHYIISCYDNDKAGQSNSFLLEKDFSIIKYTLPAKYNDLADYLPNANSEDFKNLLYSKIKEYRREKNLKISVENNCYIKYEKQKNGDTKKIEISNFIIEVDALVTTEAQPERLIRLISNNITSRTMSVNYEIFNSEIKFHSFVSSLGNFYFHGSKSDLQEITKLIFRFSDTLDRAHYFGWDSSRKLMILSNGIINENGSFLKPNKLGIFKDLLIPQSVENYIPSDNDNSHFRFISNSHYNLQQFVNSISEVFSPKIALTVFAYILASINFDWLSNSNGRNFPILAIDGQARTGKGTLLKLFLSIFSPEFKEVSLHNMSAKFMPRKLSQTPSIPVWFDEYLNSLSETKIQTLKNFFDLIGRSTAAYTGGNQTKSSRVLSPVIISGEEPPTKNEALYSRTISLSLPTISKDFTAIKKVNDLELEFSQGISHLLATLISYRSSLYQNFENDYNELIKLLQDGILNMNLLLDTRLLKNYAKIFTPLYTLCKSNKSVLNISHQKISVIACDCLVDHISNQILVDDVNVFLQNFIAMNSLPESNINCAREGYDFIYDESSNSLFLRTSVFAKASNFHYQMYHVPGKDPRALEKYIVSKKFYIGRRKKYFRCVGLSKSVQYRCVELDISKCPEFLQDFFIRTDKPFIT